LLPGEQIDAVESLLGIKHLYIKAMTKTGKPEKADDLSGVHLWLVLWKAARAVEVQAQRSIARFGMVQSDFGVLEALLHRGPLSAKQLGAKVLLTSGSVTAAIDRLAARGLVRREDDEHDRRVCIVHLTAPGSRLIEHAFAQHRTEMEEALKEFSREDRRALLPLLRRLGRIAEAASDATAVSSGMVKEAPAIKLSAGRSNK
jgi:MarR family transcriptional regulator, 2-MHQ and catechol-resistance regulon repressor